MAMTCVTLLIPSFIAVLNILALFFLLSTSAHSLIHKQPIDTVMEGVVVAEKTRLGSTPPSCHNKCNQCDPCMAVQVPTLSTHDGVRASSAAREKPLGYFDGYSSPSSAAGNRYSNYKPLGWKCRCGSHFYNP